MSFNYARTERTFFDQELEGHFKRLEGMGPDKAEVSLVSKTRDEATCTRATRSGASAPCSTT